MLISSLILAGAGCGVPTKTDEDERLADALVGRWRGRPTAAPERTWVAHGWWDAWFGPGGDFTLVVKYPAADWDLHLEGDYRLRFGVLYIDHPSLAGPWRVELRDRDRVVLHRGGLSVALERRAGT